MIHLSTIVSYIGIKWGHENHRSQISHKNEKNTKTNIQIDILSIKCLIGYFQMIKI